MIGYILFSLFVIGAYIWGIRQWTDIPMKAIAKLDLPLFVLVSVLVGIVKFA